MAAPARPRAAAPVGTAASARADQPAAAPPPPAVPAPAVPRAGGTRRGRRLRAGDARVRPDPPSGCWRAGETLLRQARLDQALESARAARRAGRELDGRLLAGRILLAMGRYREATAEYAAALRLDPTSQSASAGHALARSKIAAMWRALGPREGFGTL